MSSSGRRKRHLTGRCPLGKFPLPLPALAWDSRSVTVISCNFNFSAESSESKKGMSLTSMLQEVGCREHSWVFLWASYLGRLLAWVPAISMINASALNIGLRTRCSGGCVWGGWLVCGRLAGTGVFPGAKRSEERRVGKEGRSRWSPYH